MPNIYLAQWEWFGDPDDFIYWRSPGGDCLGSLDLRSIPQLAKAGGTPEGWGLFVYDSPRSIIDSIYLGELLDQPLKNSEKNTIKSMFNLPERPTSTTVRDLPWDLLTKYSDPTGLTAAKPLMPTASLDLELHLGGFSLIRTEKFNINTHPHRDKVISLIQDDYRRARAEDIEVGQDHYKRVLDALEEKYKVSYSVFIPPDLPDEGKLPHSTTLTDTFVETSDTNLPSHTATGPSGGFSWTRILGNTDADYTVLGASDVVRLNDTTGNSHWHRLGPLLHH